MSVLRVFLGWPSGAVWGNIVADALVAVAALFAPKVGVVAWARRLTARLHEHHQVTRDHLTAALAEHMDGLRQHVTDELTRLTKDGDAHA